MKTIASLAFNSWQENLRGRFFSLSAIFSVVFFYLSLLLGLLASDQELRVLLDAGLGFIELMGLVGAVYGASTVVLKEIETKTIYLILTRPVTRGQYLLGRFLGLMLSVLASMAFMAAVHAAILFYKGWAWSASYPLALLGIYLKVLITAALATFMALFSTSVLSGISITGILWTLGHVLPEIRFLIAHKARHAPMAPMMMLAKVLPDLQLFNLKDRLTPLSSAPPEAPLGAWFAYAAVYTAVWLLLSRWLLEKKEF